MKLIVRKTVGICVVGMLLGLLGCATKSPPKQENPYLGYVYCKTIENDQKIDHATVRLQIQEYEEAIADREMQTRTASKPVEGDYQIYLWESYIQGLERPIVISQRQWLPDSGTVKEKLLSRMKEFFEDNSSRLTIDGYRVSKKWDVELREAKSTLDNLKKTRELSSQRLKAYRQSKDYIKAIDECPVLQRYESIGNLENEVRDEASEYWVGLIKAELDKAREVGNEDQEDRLAIAYLHIQQLAEKCARPDYFKAVTAETIGMLGNNWRRRIEQLAGDGHFLQAYEFAVQKYLKLDQYQPHSQVLVKMLEAGYNEILASGIKHYADLANIRLGKDQYGIAYIYCCLAAQLYDYCAIAGFEPSSDAQSWNKNSVALMEDIGEIIHDALARRLIIYDFNSDVRNLAPQVRTACQRRYGQAGNDLAWALDVVDCQVLTPETLPPPNPTERDYMLSGTVSEFSVGEARESKNPADPEERGTDRIRQQANPNYKIKGLPFNEHQLIWAQEVDVYPRSYVEKKKNVFVDINVMYDHGMRKSADLLLVKKEFDNRELDSVTYAKYTEYGTPYPSQQLRLNPDRAALVKGDLPRNSSTDLSPDNVIYRELDGKIIGMLTGEIDRLIGKYPLELAGLATALNTSEDEQCNYRGLALAYCDKLSAKDSAQSPLARKGFIWSQREYQIGKNLEKWSKERWAGENKNNLSALSSLWEKSVELADKLDSGQ